MPQPTNRSAVGVFKETTRGTGGAATDFIPVKKFDPKDMPIWLIDKGWRGSMIDGYDQQQGPIFSQIDHELDVFSDTFGYYLSGMYGDVSFTTGTPNVWTFAPLNSGTGQPTSFCFTDGNAEQSKRWAGQQVHDLTVKGNAAGLLTATAKSTGFKSSTTTYPTTSYSSEVVLPSWNVVSTVNGATSTLVEDFEISMKRTVKVIHTNDGTADPYAVFVGAMSCTGKMTFVYEDETHYTNFLNNTRGALDFNLSTGAGAALRTVQYHSSKTGFQTAEPDRSQEYMRLPVTFQALGNITDAGASGGYSHSKWTLKNTKATGTY